MAARPTEPTIVDDFEQSYKQCLTLFSTNPAINNAAAASEARRIENGLVAEEVTAEFLRKARQVEAYFLQTRHQVAVLKPEVILKEEITEMKTELNRKDEAIAKHNYKLDVWKKFLNDSQNLAPSETASGSDVNKIKNVLG